MFKTNVRLIGLEKLKLEATKEQCDRKYQFSICKALFSQPGTQQSTNGSRNVGTGNTDFMPTQALVPFENGMTYLSFSLPSCSINLSGRNENGEGKIEVSWCIQYVDMLTGVFGEITHCP